MADRSGEGHSALEKDWEVPVAQKVNLSREKPWALQALHDLKGWVFHRRDDGSYDVGEEVIGPAKKE